MFFKIVFCLKRRDGIHDEWRWLHFYPVMTSVEYREMIVLVMTRILNSSDWKWKRFRVAADWIHHVNNTRCILFFIFALGVRYIFQIVNFLFLFWFFFSLWTRYFEIFSYFYVRSFLNSVFCKSNNCQLSVFY